jgi:hypothetical protein
MARSFARGPVRRTVLTAALTACAVMTSAVAYADDPLPGPGQTVITHVSYGGTGCPAGTTLVQLTEHGAALRVSFDQFVAQIGPGSPLASSRANCALNVKLKVPAGWRFAVRGITSHGFLNLAPGMSATRQTAVHLQGGQPLVLDRTTQGPAEEGFIDGDAVTSPVFSECGSDATALNVSAKATMRRGESTGEGYVSWLDEDDQSSIVLALVWQRCGF